MVEHRHIKTLCPPGHLVTDIAQTNNAQGLVVHLLPQHKTRVILDKIRTAGKVVAFNDIARPGQEQGKGDIGRGPVENIGCIAHRYAPLLGRSEVDVVDADAKIADNL